MTGDTPSKSTRTAYNNPVQKLASPHSSGSSVAFDQIYLALKEIPSGTDRPIANKMDEAEWTSYFTSIDNQIHKIENMVADSKQIALIESGQATAKATRIPLSMLFNALKQKIDNHLSILDHKKKEIELMFSDVLQKQVLVDIEQFSLIICRLCDYYLTDLNTNYLMIDGSVTPDNELFISFRMNTDNSPILSQSTNTSALHDPADAPDSSEGKQLPVTFTLVKAYAESMKGRFWYVGNPLGLVSVFIAIPCFSENL